MSSYVIDNCTTLFLLARTVENDNQKRLIYNLGNVKPSRVQCFQDYTYTDEDFPDRNIQTGGSNHITYFRINKSKAYDTMKILGVPYYGKSFTFTLHDFCTSSPSSDQAADTDYDTLIVEMTNGSDLVIRVTFGHRWITKAYRYGTYCRAYVKSKSEEKKLNRVDLDGGIIQGRLKIVYDSGYLGIYPAHHKSEHVLLCGFNVDLSYSATLSISIRIGSNISSANYDKPEFSYVHFRNNVALIQYIKPVRSEFALVHYNDKSGKEHTITCYQAKPLGLYTRVTSPSDSRKYFNIPIVPNSTGYNPSKIAIRYNNTNYRLQERGV